MILCFNSNVAIKCGIFKRNSNIEAKQLKESERVNEGAKDNDIETLPKMYTQQFSIKAMEFGISCVLCCLNETMMRVPSSS